MNKGSSGVFHTAPALRSVRLTSGSGRTGRPLVALRRCIRPCAVCGGSSDVCRHPARQLDELGHRQRLGTPRKEGVLLAAKVAEDGPERVAQHLAPLAERRLDHPHEEPLVAVEPLDAVAAQADDGALDLRRGIEDRLVDREEVFDVVPRLQQHAQDAVLLRAGRLGQTHGHLALNHPDAFGHQVAVLQDFEENLGRNVVREVANHLHPARKEVAELHPQEIALHKARRKLGIVVVQVGDALGVDFGAVGNDVAALQQEAGQDPHAAPHLEYVAGAAGRHIRLPSGGFGQCGGLRRALR